ncbi:hypothetical protein P389DRAFT_145348 [Cystobasidium minutum MCA 4210]|uniref:uncharacterized protein n=1 Tax=Cystobasidium minutum MCA 4210 TaxID=1397322 RepID=UPI0034CE27AF|eukprot:jgi/Rhomi1/145348/e_gw1.5.298.1
MEGTPSGSVSPRSNRPRGRKPKSTFGAGIPKDSNEYQKLRKENHKNVEKKRRETINDGIKRLSLLVPGADKNKSKIINQAAEYITVLKEAESSNIEKWTLDKLMTEKSIREMQAEIDDLRSKMHLKDREIYELKEALGRR